MCEAISSLSFFWDIMFSWCTLFVLSDLSWPDVNIPLSRPIFSLLIPLPAIPILNRISIGEEFPMVCLSFVYFHNLLIVFLTFSYHDFIPFFSFKFFLSHTTLMVPLNLQFSMENTTNQHLPYCQIPCVYLATSWFSHQLPLVCYSSMIQHLPYTILPTN